MQSTQPLKVASLLDSALDTTAMGEDLVKYAQTRDATLVKEKPGEHATWFHVRRIPTSLYQRFVMEATSDVDRRKRAFQVGIVRIENILTTEDVLLQNLVPTEHVQTPVGDLACFSDKQLEAIPACFIEEIGEVANVRAFLPGKSALSFPLRGSLLAVLEWRLSLDAGEIRLNAPKSSEQRSSEPTAPKHDASSEKPTDATATDAATEHSSVSTTNTLQASSSSSTSSPATGSTPAPGEPSTIPWSSMY